MDNFLRTNDGRVLRVNIGYNNPAAPYIARAEGGPIFGVGGPKQDNIHVMASVGEHMLTAEDVKRMGGHAGVYAMRSSLYQGLANGGPVMAAPTYVSPQYMSAPRTSAQAPIRIIAQSRGGIDLLKYIDFSIEQNGRELALEIEGGTTR